MLKCFINKSNGQVTASLPKKKIPKHLFEDIKNGKKISIKFSSLMED